MYKKLVRQQISNHPILTNIKRYIIIKGLYIDVDEPRLELLYRVEYFDGETDVSSSFMQVGPRWIVDNSYKVEVLDEEGNPIPNPNYIEPLEGEETEETPYIMKEAFDYFLEISFKAEDPIRIEDLMKFYILKDSLKGRFNF